MNKIRTFYPLLIKHRRQINLSRRFSDLYEPDYLDSMKSKIPLYDVLNIQITGHDYSILESYQKLIHNLAKNMDVDVEESWALPSQTVDVTTYKPKSEIVNSQYMLKTYHRTIQVVDVSSLQLPILLRALEASVPVGVTINVVDHADHHEEDRYVPDKELITLKQELEDISGARKK